MYERRGSTVWLFDIKHVWFVFISVALTLGTAGCGLINAVAGDSAGTVQQLWLDVPQFPDSVKIESTIPLPARIVVQQAISGKYDFIAFSSAKLPNDVVGYYTLERMKTSGWNPASAGCSGDRLNVDGGFCTFYRSGSSGRQVLAIVVTRDGKDQPTQVYFARANEGSK